MNKEMELELYRYGLTRHLLPMQQTERTAFMVELFGRRGIELYDTLCVLYPLRELDNTVDSIGDIGGPSS